MIPALAFVPIYDVQDAFDALSAECSQELISMLDCLEDSYIDRLPWRWRHPPLFPLEIWNVYDRVIQNMNRMNNHVEAAHRRVQAEFQNHLATHRWAKTCAKRAWCFSWAFSSWKPSAQEIIMLKNVQWEDSANGSGICQYGVTEYLCGIAHNFQMNQFNFWCFWRVFVWLRTCKHVMSHSMSCVHEVKIVKTVSPTKDVVFVVILRVSGQCTLPHPPGFIQSIKRLGL